MCPDRSDETPRERLLQPIKHLQILPHTGVEWREYRGMRSLVETSNSRFKDPDHEDLGNIDKRSGRGFATQYLVSAHSVASFNLPAIAAPMLKLRDMAVKTRIRQRRRKDENMVPLARPSEIKSVDPSKYTGFSFKSPLLHRITIRPAQKRAESSLRQGFDLAVIVSHHHGDPKTGARLIERSHGSIE